jgi:hypothetical protein
MAMAMATNEGAATTGGSTSVVVGVPTILDEALAMTEREMLTRAGNKVEASRTAAMMYLHSPAAVAVGNAPRAAAAAMALGQRVERYDQAPLG